MKQLLKLNLEKLEKKQPTLKLNTEGIELRENINVLYEDHFFNLQSSRDMNLPCEIWCDQFEKVEYDTVFVIFGLGHYNYISKLQKRYPDNVIVIYEPSTENIVQLFGLFDWTSVLDNYNTVFICGEERKRDLALILHKLTSNNSTLELLYGQIPNYSKIWEDEYDEFLLCVKEALESYIIDRNTRSTFKDYMARNYLYNLERITSESGIIEIYGALQRMGCVKEYPAVIVSAGPSLDKNVEDLKPYKNRAFIICVDAALRALQKHNIEPDIVVSVDSTMGDGDGYIIDIQKDYPFILHMNSSLRLVDKVKGRKFYTCNEDYYLIELFEPTGKKILPLETGGSVANTAYTFARLMEFSTIILIGQDLAYPDNKFHVSDCFEDEGEVDVSNDSKYFYVDAIDGSKVITENNMNKYRIWFENQIEYYPDIRIIDATEGGALIKGTEIMTLRDALEKECPLEKVNFREIIDSADYLLDEKDRKLIVNDIKKSRTRIDSHIEYMREGIKVYEELDSINKREAYQSVEFVKCMKKVKSFTEYMETEKDMELFHMYVHDENYEVLNELKNHEETEKDEICRVVKAGLKMIDAHIKAGEKLKADWDMILNMN